VVTLHRTGEVKQLHWHFSIHSRAESRVRMFKSTTLNIATLSPSPHRDVDTVGLWNVYRYTSTYFNSVEQLSAQEGFTEFCSESFKICCYKLRHLLVITVRVLISNRVKTFKPSRPSSQVKIWYILGNVTIFSLPGAITKTSDQTIDSREISKLKCHRM
jgi:hypothetical protein